MSADALGQSPPPSHWLRALRARFATETKLKFWSSAGVMVFFFAGYFLLLKFPIFQPTIMPRTWVDRRVPFQPGSLWIYGSLWLYVQIAPALLRNRHELRRYGQSVLALTAIGFLIFLFWPTKLAASPLDLTGHAGFKALKEVDATGNACPSLHVAFALFSALAIERILRQVRAPIGPRVFNALWCIAIAYSTLSTRQHVFLDVLGGALLAVLVAAVYLAPVTVSRGR